MAIDLDPDEAGPMAADPTRADQPGDAPGADGADGADGAAVAHPTAAELGVGLPHVLDAPRELGRLEQVVARPAVDERAVLDRATLDLVAGLVGDNWAARGSRSTVDGSADPDRQVTIMNARAAQLVAGSPERWGLAGDQLYVDLELGVDNLPAGTRLAIGDPDRDGQGEGEAHEGGAVLEVTVAPHRGCAKFRRRFGADALRWVNSPDGVRHNLRGINARVVRPGTIRIGDPVRRIHPNR